MKVLLPKVSLKKFYCWNIQADQMEGESGVIRIITNEIHSSDIQRDQMEGESRVTRSIID